VTDTNPTPNASAYHAPVMVAEVMSMLRPERGGLFLDGTLGGGGHAEALLERGSDARLIGVDRDPDALAEATARLARFGDRLRAVRSNFARSVAAAGVEDGTLHGALLDLGISSHQIDVDERGFTFRPGAPLDMRMAGSSAGERTAAALLNEMDEEDISRLFRRYAEEPRSRRLAREVVAIREQAPLATSDDLLAAIGRALGPRADAGDKARIFQGLRIAVNGEIEALETVLPALREALAPGGVLAVLSYHSLEDRVVKNAFRDWSLSCVCPPGFPVCTCRGRALGETITRKPVSAQPAEVAANVRARSARLRAWRKA
jgi:16S rRNA (cytosine1402-N4)-methyltransferase